MSTIVYQAINSVAAELAQTGIAKQHHNADGDYRYRSIDDLLKALAPLLARHKLCVLPRALDRQSERGAGAALRVTVRVAFDLVSATDGSRHTIESFGEALDDSDKATAQATSAAYKAAMFQAFCIPVPDRDDEAISPHAPMSAISEPVEGWESWAAEVIDIAKSCETREALDRLCSLRRVTLAALQRSRPELYSAVGEAIARGLEHGRKPLETGGKAPRKQSPKLETRDPSAGRGDAVRAAS